MEKIEANRMSKVETHLALSGTRKMATIASDMGRLIARAKIFQSPMRSASPGRISVPIV
jgi:hypothetical protein